MYKLTNTPFVIKDPDVPSRMWIPFDENNSDYIAYLKWLEAGNTPTPADEPQGQ